MGCRQLRGLEAGAHRVGVESRIPAAQPRRGGVIRLGFPTMVQQYFGRGVQFQRNTQMWQSLLAKFPSLADSNTAPEIKTHAFTYIPTAPRGDVLHNPTRAIPT